MSHVLSDIPTCTDPVKGIVVIADSQSAMKIFENESISRRRKHIDITYHLVRSVTDEGKEILGYISTGETAPDMLNKTLSWIKL